MLAEFLVWKTNSVWSFEISIADTDDDNHRSSKRARADFRPSAASDDDLDGMQSSPGRSQRGHPREDVLMTDQTEDDRDDVLSTLWFFSFFFC